MGEVIATSIRQALFRRMPAQVPAGIALWPTGNDGEWACCLMGVSREQAAIVLQQIVDGLTPDVYIPSVAANADDGAASEQATGKAVAGDQQPGLAEAAPGGAGRGAAVSALHPRAGHANQPE